MGLRRRFAAGDGYYKRWIEDNETLTKEGALEELDEFKLKPLISIVTPVYNIEEVWLRKFVKSVQNQWYENWELCLADDKSSTAHVCEVLTELASKDKRIKVEFRAENGGISEATNSAIAMATGDFIGFMDDDDELAPFALFEIVHAVNIDPSIDFIYSDEDKINADGARFDPFFKPGFSRQLLWSHNYITHFTVVSRELQQKVGGLKSKYDGSQDYDFILRATSAATKVHHIQKMLYHWRTLDSSVAGDPRSKMYAYEAGRVALEDNIHSAGYEGAVVEMLPHLGTYRVHLPIQADSEVLIVIPNDSSVTEGEVKQKTAYARCTVLRATPSLDICDCIKHSHAAYVVFLSDLMPVNTNWVECMLQYLTRDGVGAVGGMVRNKYRQVLNAGVTLRGLKSGNTFEGAGEWDGDVGYYFRVALPRDIFALTEDCLCVRADDFLTLNGFDESLGWGIKGIDYCMRMLRSLGKSAVWQPYSEFSYQDGEYPVINHAEVSNYLVSRPGVVDPFAAVCYPDECAGGV